MSSNRNNPEHRSVSESHTGRNLLIAAALIGTGLYLASHQEQDSTTEESRNDISDTSVESEGSRAHSTGPATNIPEVIATAVPLMPEEDQDENVSLGFHEEGEPLTNNENVQNLILQTLNDLENNPELRNRILANQRWMDDLLNPSFTNWSDRNLLERDYRGLGFTPEILQEAASLQDNWNALFTTESFAQSQNPNLRDSSQALLQFAVDPIELAREGELNIGVTADNAEYYFFDYANIANIQPVLYAAAVDALIASGVNADDATIREAAVIFANNWRQFHGLTNAAGVTTVDTNGTQSGGNVSFRHGPFLNVCEVYQPSVASNDPLDQVENTRTIDIVPLINEPNELTTHIPWGSAQSNERGQYITAVRIGHISGHSSSSAGLAQELLLASAQTTWNHTDNYIHVGSAYETEENAVFHTYLPCPEEIPEVIPTVTPAPEQPPVVVTPPEETCEQRGDCETDDGKTSPYDTNPNGNDPNNPDDTIEEANPTETTVDEANNDPFND